MGRRRLGTVPGLGHPLRGRHQVCRRAHAGAVGTQRRRPLHALHGRHHRDAQGRHVAPGRPLRAPHRRRRAPLRRERRDRGGTGCGVGIPRRRDPDAGVPPDARDRRLHGEHDAGRRRAGLSARVAQVRPRRAARHGRAGEGQRPGDRRRPVLTTPDRRTRRAPGPLGPELAADGDLLGRHVERAGEAGAARPPPQRAAGRRVQLVGGARHGHVGLGRRRGRARRRRSPSGRT